MVGPVCIENPDLCHSRIAPLLRSKIVLNMLKILKGHGKPQGIIELFELRLRHIYKVLPLRQIFKNCHIRRFLIDNPQRLRFLHTGLPGIHRIDTVVLDLLKLLIGDIADDHVGNCRLNDRLFIFF